MVALLVRHFWCHILDKSLFFPYWCDLSGWNNDGAICSLHSKDQTHIFSFKKSLLYFFPQVKSTELFVIFTPHSWFCVLFLNSKWILVNNESWSWLFEDFCSIDSSFFVGNDQHSEVVCLREWYFQVWFLYFWKEFEDISYGALEVSINWSLVSHWLCLLSVLKKKGRAGGSVAWILYGQLYLPFLLSARRPLLLGLNCVWGR